MFNAKKRRLMGQVVTRPGRKLAIVNVADYPASKYTAHWEYFVDPTTNDWHVRMNANADGAVLDEQRGEAKSEDEARFLCQTWALNHIEQYRKAG